MAGFPPDPHVRKADRPSFLKGERKSEGLKRAPPDAGKKNALTKAKGGKRAA
jgi:hypothetical protein